jgi:hypothetical protein
MCIIINLKISQDYMKAPSDLLFFLKLTEGYFKNRGTSKLIFILNIYSYLWGYDNLTPPSSCNEDEFWDNSSNMCSSKY